MESAAVRYIRWTVLIHWMYRLLAAGDQGISCSGHHTRRRKYGKVGSVYYGNVEVPLITRIIDL